MYTSVTKAQKLLTPQLLISKYEFLGYIFFLNKDPFISFHLSFHHGLQNSQNFGYRLKKNKTSHFQSPTGAKGIGYIFFVFMELSLNQVCTLVCEWFAYTKKVVCVSVCVCELPLTGICSFFLKIKINV